MSKQKIKHFERCQEYNSVVKRGIEIGVKRRQRPQVFGLSSLPIPRYPYPGVGFARVGQVFQISVDPSIGTGPPVSRFWYDTYSGPLPASMLPNQQ
ncbi:hypothetical protein N7478_000723 [Penicillium angulare]|uniref:uncharacterized protein n=1 Tax=Penicillium angulare TaxID=116970 RepID=UPI0025414D39|nr:uncharacterized protein N7478_000723 [Penicillium angulare]KAJ5291472.1 hypothetical protein N7478_000723 [Penicillium angulare]